MRPVRLAVILLILTSPAFAQGTIEVGGSLQWLQDIVVAVVSGVIAVAVPWVSYLLWRVTGVKIEKERADVLAMAAQRQASSLIADGFVKLQTSGKISVPSAAMAAAVNEVLKSVPEAVKHFNLDKEEIADRIVDYIPAVPETEVTKEGQVVGVSKQV